jgi:hypothetical protein
MRESFAVAVPFILWGSARVNAGRQGLAGSFPCRLV